MKEIIITGCVNCPFCIMNEMSSGYSCSILERPNNFIKESKRFTPITPDWCPAKEGGAVVKYSL